MRLTSLIILFATFLLLFSSETAKAEPVAVIVNAGNSAQSLTIEDLRKYYENDILSWPDGTRIVLINLSVNSDARKKFSRTVLKREALDVAREWSNRKITNTAKNPPLVVKSELLVQARIARISNAIGYLAMSKVTSDKVRIVLTIK
ncbi:MAG: hypothetical protein IME96_00165 [Proteobacteria bacterium]|nr:hypothetical protein [Pseudomonadota bacterium]